MSSDAPALEAELSLNSQEGALRMATLLQDFVRNLFERDGKLDITACLFANTGLDGETFSEPKVVVFPIGGATKDVYSSMLRLLVRKTRASGVVFMSEVWTAVGTTKEDAKRFQSYQSLGEAPEAQEALLLLLEHRTLDAPLMWHALIEREASKVKITEFKKGFPGVPEGEGASYSGQFTNILKSFDADPRYN